MRRDQAGDQGGRLTPGNPRAFVEPARPGADHVIVTHRRLNTVASELLVLHCQAGDERALAALYEHWGPRLARHAARLTGRQDAVADVCQDAWLAIARGIGRLDDPARFPAWAYRIVSRRCADWVRQRVRARSSTTALDGEHAAPAEDLPDADEISRLRHAMRRLPPDQQAVLALHYGEGLGVRDIAVALAVPIGTVKSRLHHARRTLSDALERDDR